MNKAILPTDDLKTCAQYIKSHKNFTAIKNLDNIIFYYILKPIDQNGKPFEYTERSITYITIFVAGIALPQIPDYAEKMLIFLSKGLIKKFKIKHNINIKNKYLNIIIKALNSGKYKLKYNTIPKHYSLTFIYTN